MPIRIVESAEPLSRAAQERGLESLLIDSDASRLLAHEMLRYCEGEVSGRSFLVAGHRGAGKTTMVSNAHLQATRETARRERAARPLIVWLHGPSLFPQDRKTDAPAPASGGGQPTGATTAVDKDGRHVTVIVNQAPAPPPAPGAAPARVNETALALEQITLALHRAVAREFAAGFQRRAESRIEFSARLLYGEGRPWMRFAGTAAHMSRAKLLELAELAASFERELYESPDDTRLREYWRRANALRTGVLFAPGHGSGRSLDPSEWTRGSLELVALSGISQAYRRISGKYELLEATKDEAQSKQDVSFGVDSTAGKLFGPITALLSGGLVGAGVLAGTDASGPGATVAGILAALGASLVFKMSSSRSRAATASREEKFIFDLSATTLDRILPILIERLRRAGLAPIFVVDELDKVDQLSQRILGMVHHLKKLVAENAFFAFLTDRTYFERLSQRTGTLAYPVEYTYYTHLVFVSFSARDFHEYLSGRPAAENQPKRAGVLQLIAEGNPTANVASSNVASPNSANPDGASPNSANPDSANPDGATPNVANTNVANPNVASNNIASNNVAGPNVASATAVTGEMGGIQAQTTASADDLDLEVLPYFLLHRAQLHPLDLKRQLSSLRNADGNLAMRRGQVRGEGYRLDVQMQVAIEMILDRELFRAYLVRDPDDRRLVHDATYYLTRQWRREEAIIDLSDSGADAFSTYLSDRIGTEGVLPESVTRARAGDASPALDTERMVIDETTREFLLNGVRSLAAMLADHDLFERYLDAWNVERQAEGRPPVGGGVRDALQLRRSVPLLHRVGDEGSNRYAWSYDRAGLQLVFSPVGAAADEFAPPGALTDIDEDIAYIRAFSAALADIVPAPIVSTKIDFAALSSLLRVISTSPPWDEASSGIQRLTSMGQGGKAYDTRARDEQNVRGFARLLRDDAELIYRALLAGAYAGRLSGGAVSDQVIRGLQAIRTAYRFEEKSEAGVNESLRTFFANVSQYYGKPISEVGRPLADTADAPGWLEALRKDLRAIVVLSPMGVPFSVAGDSSAMLSVSEVQIAAWRSAITRIDAMFTGQGSELRAGIEELMCDAAQVAPSTVVPLRLETMGIVHWSDAFYRAVAFTSPTDPQHVPLMIAPIALRALGFGVTAGSSLAQLRKAAGNRPEIEMTQATQFMAERQWFAATADGPSAVIIRRTDHTMVGSWLPSRQVPAIAATYDQLPTLSLLEFLAPAKSPAKPAPTLIAIEEPQEVTVTHAQWKRGLTHAAGDRPIPEVRFYPELPRQVPNVPYLVEPRSVDDLVTRGLELTSSANKQS